MNHQAVPATSKRSRVKLALVAGIAAATLALGGVALARPHGGPGGPGGPGRMMMRALHDLDLTEQQEVKAVRIRRNVQEQAQTAHQELRGSMSKVADELEKANPDAQKLHGLADEVIQRMSKIAHSAVDQLLELHATFSPEQRTRLAQHLRNFQPGAGDEERGPGRGERGLPPPQQKPKGK